MVVEGLVGGGRSYLDKVALMFLVAWGNESMYFTLEFQLFFVVEWHVPLLQSSFPLPILNEDEANLHFLR